MSTNPPPSRPRWTDGASASRHRSAAPYFEPGGYVAIGGDGGTLGQVHDVELTRHDGVRVVAGDEAILDGGGDAFIDAAVAPARPERVAAWLERVRPARASLHFGELVLAPGVPLELDAGGFDRHTFLCGQSGSGKTYALGGVLERLLAQTGLRLVILDPNSDHVRLGEVREGVDPEVAARYRAVTPGVGVRRAGGDGANRLRLRFARLSPRLQAALLRLDPIRDREEYSLMCWTCSTRRRGPPVRGFEDLRVRRARPGAVARPLRARNLGARRAGASWAREDPRLAGRRARPPRPALPRRRPRQPARRTGGAGARGRRPRWRSCGRTGGRAACRR